jgi:hypothetical protein
MVPAGAILSTNWTQLSQFFDRTWSVGKVLDMVASAGSVENFNNRPNGPYVRTPSLGHKICFLTLANVLLSQKLYLFSLKTGAILNFSSALCDIETNVLDTGDCILLEMVANKKK